MIFSTENRMLSREKHSLSADGKPLMGRGTLFSTRKRTFSTDAERLFNKTIALLGACQSERAGVALAREEADKLFVVGAPDPVEHTAVFLAQVSRTLEHDHFP